jgi:C4-dicarboxylate transporter, DctQ subunit
VEKNNSKLMHFLNNFEGYLATAIMIIMTILLFLQVVTRYIFGYAIVWTEEISIIFFVWVIYLGISSCTTEGGHIRIDVLPDALSPKKRRILLMITDLIVVAFCLYIIPPLISITLAQGSSTSVMLKIPMQVAYGIVPFGMALTAIRGIQSFIRALRNKPGQIDNLDPLDDHRRD